MKREGISKLEAEYCMWRGGVGGAGGGPGDRGRGSRGAQEGLGVWASTSFLFFGGGSADDAMIERGREDTGGSPSV